MRTVIYPSRETWKDLCGRKAADYSAVAPRVEAILQAVESEGDAALVRLMKEIDRVDAPIPVSEQEIAEAAEAVSPAVREAIGIARENIMAFHRAQMPAEVRVETRPGVVCVQRPVPIHRVGLYVPGGSAPLFSTVLMLAVPAALAGCPEVILCTPSAPDGRIAPEVLYSASLCGIRRIYRLGGAQAVAAMAFGTETVPKVDKIFGPGNRYVTLAKQLVSQRGTAIDMPAGPSEVMVMADNTARPAIVAADLLSQAEHGRDSQAVLVCRDKELAAAVLREVDRQVAQLPRREIISASLENSLAVVLPSADEMLAFAEEYAPEHLIISMEDAAGMADRITAAGSVFVGNWAPESAGDYASGTNHTLPTSGWAKSCSGVNMDSFLRKMTLQTLTRDGLRGLAPTITAMAGAEGLQAHANAVTLRLQADE